MCESPYAKERELTTLHEVDQSRRCAHADSRAALSKQAHLFLDLHVFGKLWAASIRREPPFWAQIVLTSLATMFSFV